MAYLHNELPGSITPHGHFKSSNVLLDKSFKRPLTDYAPRPLINPDNAHTLMAAYKSPQYAHNAKISKKSDVWSLGILITIYCKVMIVRQAYQVASITWLKKQGQVNCLIKR